MSYCFSCLAMKRHLVLYDSLYYLLKTFDQPNCMICISCDIMWSDGQLGNLLGGKATPYPFESKRPPIWVRPHFLSVMYSMVVDSMRKAYLPSSFTTRSIPSWFWYGSVHYRIFFSTSYFFLFPTVGVLHQGKCCDELKFAFQPHDALFKSGGLCYFSISSKLC